ncbi:MAG: hypothetical protein HOP28_03775 [Gemmatimonadales bacterium]|nr:hypothetical protein [Gemmatimonadales bacterium]
MSLLGMVRGLTDARIDFVVIGGVAGRAHGATRVTDDLDICYSRERANLERLANLLDVWHAYPRGIEPGLPFIMDRRTLENSPVLTLTTDHGSLDLLDQVNGVGDFTAVSGASVVVATSDGIRFRVLGLESLIRAKRATKRKKDLDQLPELLALLQLKTEGG